MFDLIHLPQFEPSYHFVVVWSCLSLVAVALAQHKCVEFSAVQAVDAVEAGHLGLPSGPCQRFVEAAEAAEAEVEAIMKEEVWMHRCRIRSGCSLCSRCVFETGTAACTS